MLQLVHITVTVTPSPLALGRGAVLDNLTSALLDLGVLLRRRVRSDCLPLPVDRRPLLPWALFPSRVLARCWTFDPTRLRIGPFDLLPPASSRRYRRTVPPTLPLTATADSHRRPRLALPPVRFWPACCQVDPPVRSDSRAVRLLPRPGIQPPKRLDTGPRLRTLLGFVTSKSSTDCLPKKAHQPRFSVRASEIGRAHV